DAPDARRVPPAHSILANHKGSRRRRFLARQKIMLENSPKAGFQTRPKQFLTIREFDEQKPFIEL
ncbi:MAG: hypothetical protein FWD98_06520, partial [Defluviitaleaceae bacterium]|nr:hypothetical protein [Defluviitaleaceae bacterium]